MCPGVGRNLILTGFMGTGKTWLGREVARRMGRPFVDMDALVEERAGMPVARIFAESGEEAFRQMEANLCRELAQPQGLVISTGGGALLRAENRALLQQGGVVVCLNAPVDEILRRLQDSRTERPLLNVPDPRAEIARLLAARREAYAAIPWQIDTEGRSLDSLAEEVMALAEVRTLAVRHLDGSYPIHIGAGLLDQIGGALRAADAPQGCRVGVVSNPVVAPHYAYRVCQSLESRGFHPALCTIPDGEPHKTLATVSALYDQFLQNHMDRSSVVLSLGGGVTGDIAGFAAATFMRGVRFAQIPTSLLAMADASVGGKTGVDLPQGKNLVGAFKQPLLVLIDPATLETLPIDEARSGMAEVLKHGILADPELFASLKDGPTGQPSPLTVEQWVRVLRVKIEVVEEDPLEAGRRAVLNLGHTVGHALERLSRFSLRHGEGVSIGLVAAARISVELARAPRPMQDAIESALSAWGLPIRCPAHPIHQIWEAMTHDKKRQGRDLRWILPEAIGRVTLVDRVPRETVERVLLEMGARREP